MGGPFTGRGVSWKAGRRHRGRFVGLSATVADRAFEILDAPEYSGYARYNPDRKIDSRYLWERWAGSLSLIQGHAHPLLRRGDPAGQGFLPVTGQGRRHRGAGWSSSERGC